MRREHDFPQLGENDERGERGVIRQFDAKRECKTWVHIGNPGQ
jgi:hypothetical protein